MKRFLKKRWLGLPVGIITVVLLVIMLAGTALAVNGYIFFRGNVDAEVREAIAVGAFDSWDNLHPYGSDANAVWVDNGEHNDGMGTLGDVDISIVPDNGGYVLTIATAAETPYVGEGFVAGEWIVIPINLRNGSSVALNLGAGARAGTLILEYSWLTNTGTRTAWESGQEMARDFKGGNVWAPLDGWRGTIPGYGGKYQQIAMK